MKSIFSKIIDREIPASIVYEDEKHIAILDIAPFESGHTLVIPKKEYETIFDMPEEEYIELQKVVLKIAKHYEKVLDAGMNIFQSNKAIAGQEVMHVHFHILPRKTSDSFVLKHGSYNYSEEEKKELLSKIQLS